jgi:hypothetical protein
LAGKAASGLLLVAEVAIALRLLCLAALARRLRRRCRIWTWRAPVRCDARTIPRLR